MKYLSHRLTIVKRIYIYIYNRNILIETINMKITSKHDSNQKRTIRFIIMYIAT